eukprot:4592797-Prymnesium_polylepis.1
MQQRARTEHVGPEKAQHVHLVDGTWCTARLHCRRLRAPKALFLVGNSIACGGNPSGARPLGAPPKPRRLGALPALAEHNLEPIPESSSRTRSVCRRTCVRLKCGWRDAARRRNLRHGSGNRLPGLCLREPRLCPRILGDHSWVRLLRREV